MSQRETDNPNFPEGEISPAAAVRAAADGELSPERLDAFRDDLTESRLAFERALRDATARVMAEPATAPDGLRRRVLEMAADAAGQGELADRLSARADETRHRSFWTGRHRLIGALAAVLVLTVAGVFISSTLRATGRGGMLAYRTDLAAFVSAEHTRTLDDRVAAQKYIYTTVNDAVDNLGETLHQTPAVLPCGDEIDFRGAGPCGVPGVGPSCHFQYIIHKPDGSTGTVSVFVKQDHGELDLEPGVAYRVKTDECGLAGFDILVWQQSGLLYTLVAGEDIPKTECGDLLDQFGITRPDPQHEL